MALNLNRAAHILAEATIHGDQQASERYGLTTRTIQNYRKRLTTDEELSRIFHTKRTHLEQQWADQLAPAILAASDFLRRAAIEADPKDPKAIRAVAGALKILSSITMTKEVLDARTAFTSQPRSRESPPPGGHLATA